MICPVCKSDMIVIEYRDIELDYCTNCKGVWFDSGELELFLGPHNTEESRTVIDSSIHSREVISLEKKRKCPICGRKMKKMVIGEKPQILIDVCDKNHGLWFDGGEVAQMIRNLPAEQLPNGNSREQVMNFLGEVFKAPE